MVALAPCCVIDSAVAPPFDCTQLRHDALLHVQQAYTMILGCDYPAGMVDPRPATWRAIAGLARRTAAAFTATGETDTAQRVSRFFRDTFAKTVDDLATIAQAQVRPRRQQ